MLQKEQLEENIISLLGIQALPDKQKLALLGQMSDLIQKRISLRILEQLNEEEQTGFIDASANNDEVKTQEILKSKNIDLMSLVEEEVGKLKEEMKGTIESLKV